MSTRDVTPGVHESEAIEDHDRGLSHDLPRIASRGLGRRGLFAVLGGVGAATTLAACGEGPASGTSRTEPGAAVAAGEIPEETAGPFPGDGTNGPNVLTESGAVRSDLTASFGEASGRAEGMPLRLKMRVYDLEGEDVTVLEGAAVYVWHADREGRYSMYSEGVEDQNYLRGVQVSDADGNVEFTTVFPGCYDGRWPHVHFEVYPSLEAATSAGDRLRTSQLAFPQDACEQVYGAEGYEDSVANLARVSLSSDLAFGDGHSLQLARMSGSNDAGWVATLNVPV